MEDNVIEINPTPVRDFLNRHKTAITVVTTATVCLVISRIAVSQREEYMEERGILDDFNALSEDEE